MKFPLRNLLAKRVVCSSVAVVGFLVVATGPYLFWYADRTRIPADEKFDLQFGRGSGWHGLDLLRITSDGRAEYEYQADHGEWRRKTFVVPEHQLTKLRQEITELNPWGMDRAYHRNVADGTQWCFLVRIDGKSKSVYFDNNFPNAIRRFADVIDQTVLVPFADPVEAEVVPQRHHRKHEKEIWASIR